VDNQQTVKEVLAELTTQDLLEIHNSAATMVRERQINGPQDITKVWVEAVLVALLNKSDIGWIP
jgi:DNA-binding FadR family transcriptional regulator